MAVQSGQRKTTPVPVDAQAKRHTTSEIGTERSVPEFVGRDDALTAVVEALEHGPALVLIEGEPGIGKTRLLREALTAIKGTTSSQGQTLGQRRVLVAACPALKDPFPLGAVVDGLRRLVRPDSGLGVGELGLSALCGALRPLFPEWADQLPPSLEGLDDPKETRHRLLRALTELVERLDVDVLVVEDAHWADTATLEWLLTLTAAEPVPDEATPGEIGRSIVVSYRPTDVPERSLLLRLTSRPPAGMNQVRVILEPLDVDQTRELVASMFHTGEVSEQFATFLHERTDGVPLAVEECVRLLRDRKDIVRTSGQWSRRALENLQVPPTVRDSVLERVERLHPDVRAVLHAAAVLAAPSDEHLLTTVAGLDEQTTQLAVTAALASGLLQETAPSRFVFRHVLDAQAIAESIQPSDSRRMHARAAEALLGVEPKPVVRLARHYREAGDTEGWCHFAEASADLALESGHDHTAVTVLLDVLTGAEHTVEQQAKLALKLGDAAGFGAVALGQDLEWRMIDVLRDTAKRDDVQRRDRGEIRLHLGQRLRQLSQEQAAYTEVEAAIPDLDHCPDRAMLAMTILAYPLVPNPPAAWHLQWLDRAAELLPWLDATGDRLSFAMNRATALLLLGEEAGWQVAAEAPEPRPNPREQRIRVTGSLNLAQAATVWGHYADARERLQATVELMQTTGFQGMRNTSRAAEALLDWYIGDWKSARQTANEVTATDDAALLDRLQARQILGMLDLASGARTAEQRLRTVADNYAQLGSVEPAAVIAPAGLSRLHLASDATDAALRITQPVMTMIARKGVWHWAADIAPVHADALVRAGRVDHVDTLVDQLSSWAERRDAPAPEAALATCQAISAEAHGDHNLAATLFADAAAEWAALPRPYDELLAMERQGGCLLAAGETEQALTLLSDIQDRLRALGAKWDADRIAHLLRQHGVEVPHVWHGGRRGYGDQLSPRELEVVELVARGMTNKQVAEVLFVSSRTVAMHLSSAMRKLGVASRTSVAMAAADAGLLALDSDSTAE